MSADASSSFLATPIHTFLCGHLGVDGYARTEDIPAEVGLQFHRINQEAYQIVGEGSSTPAMIRDIYRAGVVNGNPLQALVFTRRALAQADVIAAGVQQFKTSLLGLLADIEATIPTEPTHQ